jgi:Lon protease-like protein
MLGVLRSSSRKAVGSHIGIYKTKQVLRTTSPYAAWSHHCFWSFSRRDDDEERDDKSSSRDQKQQDKGTKNDDATEVANADIKSASSKVGLIAPYGDNSPTLSPLLILPTTKKPIFPGYLSAITLKNESIIEALVDGKVNHPNYVGVFLRKEDSKLGSNDQHGDVITHASEIYSVGTFAQVQNIVRTDLGAQLILMGHRRINLQQFTTFGPPAIADVKHWKRTLIPPTKSSSIKAHTNEVLNVARELIKMSPLLQEQLQLHNWVSRVDLNDPCKLADFATALTTAEGFELQRVLETEDIEERLMIVLELLAKEKELAKLQKEISRQVEEKVSKQQREYFLREQLKSIKKVCVIHVFLINSLIFIRTPLGARYGER